MITEFVLFHATTPFYSKNDGSQLRKGIAVGVTLVKKSIDEEDSTCDRIKTGVKDATVT